MAGFATFTAVNTALTTAGSNEKIPFTKQLTGTIPANIAFSLWKMAGMPSAGAGTTSGVGNAATCSSATTGAIKFNNAPASQNAYLQKVSYAREYGSGSSAGTYLLVDRLAHCSIAQNQADASFSPVIDGTARLAAANAGDYRSGAMMIIEVNASTLGGANSFALTYTNEGGTGGRVTPALSSISGRNNSAIAYNNTIWVPLQAGDVGVRSIESWDLQSGSNSSAITIALVKPLAWFSHQFLAAAHERDFAIQCQNLVEIPDDACLQFMFISAATNTGLDFTGDIVTIKA